MITITEQEYNELIEASQKLNALECAGVDNWEGYSEGMKLLGQWKQEEVDFSDYVAVCESNSEVASDEGGMVWWITTKEFWHENHYMDDGEPTLDIPAFGNAMENCYEHARNGTYEEQAKLLSGMGFEVIAEKDANWS